MSKITFPIATYNRVDIIINRTLPSILNQEFKDIEVVIVGDCVNERDWERLKDSIDDSRVRMFNLRNRTLYPSDPFEMWCVVGCRPRNIAAKLATGDWHWWISDDDEVAPNAIQKTANFIKNNKDAVSIYGNYLLKDIGGVDKIIDTFSVQNGLDFKITGMPAWVVRSDISKAFKWNSKSFQNEWNKPSDYALQSRMYAAGVKFTYYDECIAINHMALPDKGLTGSAAYKLHPEFFV